ncbi:FKBP-type peptidyl-prolyl cis-trans isomerase N-terminal domain-containing protein [Methylomonas sp. HW2-6]|uniref:FKBP-type peptidyl-prolyl cis-trans isomerase N-terminal domain-containing protein n=1 Tax=Methylomonas TaxID=416 RepID=UPI00112835E8|nr:FKBP-type peptidyl-prolyl cis-trans isomerase N-terminal domain-containing protein [Methylomonas koyamae]TPQ29645.1 hypothetical protein C2U68_01065 [Methylomonas koyamae]
MTSPKLCALALLVPLWGCATAPDKPAEPAALDTEQRQSSYAQGVKYMQNLKVSDIPLDQELFLQGMNDVLHKRPLRLNPEQLQKGQDWVFVQHVMYTEKLAAANQAKSEAFLQQNRSQPGVTTTPSGLQYQVLIPGREAGAKPAATDSVRLQYRIARLDGNELTANKPEVPAEVPLSGLVPGWREALGLMTPGAKWRLFLPPELAYGADGLAGKVQPNEALIVDLELLEIKSGGTAQMAPKKTLTAGPGGDVKPTSRWLAPAGGG